MQRFLYIALLIGLLGFSQSVIFPHIGNAIGTKPKEYNVDLDAAPIDKWAAIINDHKEELQQFLSVIDTLVPIPEDFYDLIGDYGIYSFKFKQFIPEMQAIADLAQVPFGKVFLLNFLYDITAFKFCTSIVARTSSGKIIHGRNLDFPFWRMIAGLSVNVNFMRQGQVVYQANVIAGAIFFITGQKPGKFAISVDERQYGSIFRNIKDFFKGYYPSIWLVGTVLEEENDFDSAVKRLSETNVISPIYYIVSGTSGNQGAIIEKETVGVNNVYYLTDDEWFLVQTNYDKEKPEPATDKRKQPAIERMNALGPNITEDQLLNFVLMKWPNFNIETLLSTIMSPSTEYFNTTLWY